MLAEVPGDTPKGLRDRAILLLGFAGAFRRSELVALRVEDLAETPDGLRVLIRHSNGWVTAYAHNSALNVKRGEPVRRGQIIAKSGSTGNVSTPQRAA